jgi:hypothetical protein
MRHLHLLPPVLLTLGMSLASAADLPAKPDTRITSVAFPAKFDTRLTRLGKAQARVAGAILTVTTGRIVRDWTWTGKGLVTTAMTDEFHKVYATGKLAHACDWELPGILDVGSAAELVSIDAHVSNDEGFSNQYLEVITTIRYPVAKLEFQHVIWAFPDAPGLRVQLRVKALPGFDPKPAIDADRKIVDCGGTKLGPGARVDHLPVDFSQPNSRRYWGIYNDPGNRLDQSKPMLEEKVITGYPLFQPESIDWASGVAVECGGHGVILVKESPKTVNQPAHLTGAFFATPQGLDVTGWGLAAAEILPDRFRECWATWSICYTGGPDGMQLALKTFDAARYPVLPQRDLFILSNTWGPANPLGGQFTSEEHLLKEIPALGALGIDVAQIDDGWQRAGGGPGAKQFLPKYAQGWTTIKAAADKANLRLGLWVAIRNAEVADLQQNLDDLGFISWKADFEHLASRSDYENRISRFRAVMKHAWMKTQFTLCPEYDDPRYGWYFAKEYGSIYFQNNQEALPHHLTMVPYQVLRQHWLMAKYFPANKLQVMLQNPKRTDPSRSDGNLHSHGYCFAMGMPFVPCFFQSAQNLDPAGTAELKELIRIYKQHREEIFTSITFPVGDLPNNATWTGFQMVGTRQPGTGHLLVFRELHNPDASHAIALKFLAGKTLTLTDCATGATRTVTAGPAGEVEFQLPAPASYGLYHYEIKP